MTVEKLSLKRFIDENGTFEIFIPINWNYSLKDEKVHTFQYYLKNRNFDTFQLSILDFDKDYGPKRFKMMISGSKYKIFNDNKYFNISLKLSPDKNPISYTSKIDNKIVLFTFLLNIEKELDHNEYLEKNKFVLNILSKFRLINPENSKSEYESYLFAKFIDGIGASAFLLNNAIKNDCFIEATAIFSNQIDALLRTAIVLNLQLTNNNKSIERKYIYQGSSDKIITEKSIYQEAKNLNIIDDDIFNELNKLYEFRNRVIHRFIISEITVADIDEIAFKYYTLREKISKIVENIEEEQIKKNIGMTVRLDKGSIDLSDFVKSKFGSLEYT